MIMKKFLFLTLAVALGFSACKKDNKDPEPDPINTSDTTKNDTAVVVPVDSTEIKAAPEAKEGETAKAPEAKKEDTEKAK